MKKQVDKLELPASLKIYNVFYISLLEQNIIKKGRMNKLLLIPEFEASNNKKYELKAIQNGKVYANEANGLLLGLYNLVV